MGQPYEKKNPANQQDLGSGPTKTKSASCGYKIGSQGDLALITSAWFSVTSADSPA